MKRIVKSFALLAVAASALVSCKGELTTPEEKPQTGKFEYTFTLGAPETKALLASDSEGYFAQWEVGDKLGIYTLNNASETTNNTAADIDISKNPVEFKVVTSYALDERSEVYAYFPYDAENSTVAAEDPSKVVLSIPASQTGSLNAMPMAAKPYAVTKPISVGTEPIADIKMRNLGSILNFNVFSSVEAYRSETVSSIAFTTETPLCGSFTYDIMEAELADITGYEGTTVTVTKNITPGNDKNSGNTVPMVVAPNATAGYKGTIVVTTNVATYTYTISSPIKIDRSLIKKVNVDLGSSNADRQLNDQVYFIETFDGNEGTGGNDGQWNGTIASNTITADHYTTGDKWTFVSGGGASACIKLGAGNSLGSAQTPGLKADGTVKLTFKAAAWNTNNESTTLKLSCSNNAVKFYNSGDEEITSVTMVKASWTTYSLTVKNLAKGDKIKFEGYQSTNSRFFLDNVAVFTGAMPSFIIDPTAIAMSDETAEIVAGKTKKLTANFTPVNTTNRAVTWASDDDDVATVEGGTVTAVGAGTTTITATSEADPALVATCVVTVTAEPLVMTTVTCAPGKDYLDFSWTAVTNAIGYKYSEDNETWSGTISETSHRISGLANNTTKTLYVKAVGNGVRYGESNVKSASGTTSNLVVAQFNANDYSGVESGYSSTEKSFTSATGTWFYKNVSQTSNMLQIQATSGYIAITTPGYISKVEIYNVENGSASGMAGNKTFYWKDATSGTINTIASYTTPSGGLAKDATVTLTADPAKEATRTAVISCTNALRTNQIMVYYEDDGKKSVVVKNVSNGTITATPLRQTPGETVTLGNTPATGYELSSYDVKDASSNVVSVTDGTFIMPDSDVTVSGTFSKVNYTLTDASGENGSINFSKNPANYQDVVTITVNPETGYRMTVGSLKAYKTGDEQTSVAISGSNTITMPAYPVTVECQFEDASIKETLSRPSISSASGTTTAVSGAWGEVSHATGYNWYVSTANTWGSAGDASVKASGSVKSNSLSGVSLGTTLAAGNYYLYVQAVDNTGYYNNSVVSEGKSYTITASNRITTLDKLTTGNYVIVGQQTTTGYGKLKYGSLSSSRIPYTQSFTSVQPSVTTTDNDEKWLVTVSVSDSKTTITLKNIGQSKYIGGTLSWQTNASNALSFEVSVDNGVFKLKNPAANNYLGVNTTSNWWKVYAAGNLYNSGSCIYFYKID